MKNLKKIIATVLATTLIMSTNVFAATTTPTTYGEAYQAQLTAAKVPANVQTMMKTIFDLKGLTQDNADYIEQVVAKCNSIRAGRPNAEVKADQKAMDDLQQQGLNLLGEFRLAVKKVYNDKKEITSYLVTDSKNNDKVVLTIPKEDTSGLTGIDESKLHEALQAALDVQKYGAGAALPGTGTGTGTGTATGTTQDPVLTPAEQLAKNKAKATAEVNAIVDKIDADTALNADQKAAAKTAAAKILKGIADGTINYTDAKAAIDALPDSQTKTDLLAALDRWFPTSTTDTAGNSAFGGSTGTNGTTAIATTPATLAKTATNNGNVAVAGLAMIAVAGTVFFVSKKKIA